MNRLLITQNDSNIDKQNRSQIYTIATIKGNYNPPQCSRYIPSFQNLETLTYEYEINDSNLEGCNNFSLTITLPEIKGFGKVCYYKNFVFLAIKNFKILIDGKLIKELSGEEIKSNYIPSMFSEKKIGNTEDLCNLKEGKGNDFIIFERQKIDIPIKTIFDSMDPHSILRLYSESKLTFIVEFYSIEYLLAYNRIFEKQSISKLIEEFSFQGYEPILSIQGYNTIDSKCENIFIEQLEYSKGNNLSTAYVTPTFNSITGIFSYVITDDFTKKYHISYPGLNTSEKAYINSFVERLANDLIVISKDDSILIRNNENENGLFPINSKFKEVKRDKNGVGILYFNKNNRCEIYIDGLSEDDKIFYHTNILTFSRRESTEFNISHKFKKITGIYLPTQKKIKFFDIEHNITIHDVSIPVEKWRSDVNDSCGDLRSFKSRDDDIFINNRFIIGMDFSFKDKGFSKIEIKSGNSETIVPELGSTYDVFKLPKINFSPYSFDENQIPNILFTSFNSNDIPRFEPSRITADNTKNFINLQLFPTWNIYNDNDPKKLSNRFLVSCIIHIKYLVYTNKREIYIYNVDSEEYKKFIN